MASPRTHPAAQPHGPLVEAFPDVFIVKGSVRMGPGMRIPRNMVVLRHDGALTLISAVRLDVPGLAALDALGAVAHVVKLGFFHGMDDGFYVDRDQAQYWALPGIDGRAGVEPTQRLGADPFPVPGVQVIPFEAAKRPEAVLHASGVEGGLLIACDSVQHWTDTDGCSLGAKLATRAMGFMRPMNIGPPWRKFMSPEPDALAAGFRALLALDFEHAIGAHGGLCRGGAKAALAASIERVYR